MYKKLPLEVYAKRKWHKLSELNEEKQTAICTTCGPVNVKLVARGKGRKVWRCINLHKHKTHRIDQPYAIHKKESCERCSFVPENACQLDIHHRDGNHLNNDPSNLMTLCANCHRLYSLSCLRT